MRNLLSSYFCRLLKSKVFCVLELVVAGWSGVMYILMAYNTRVLGEQWMVGNAHVYFFYFLLYIGVVMGIFTSLFLGTEYDCGTIRNKLTAGYQRSSLYLANLILVTAVGILFMLTHMLVAVVIGVPTVGMGVLRELHGPVWRIACCLCVIGCYGALFTMLAMVDTGKARCAVISLLAALAIVFCGMLVYGKVTMEPTKEHMVQQPDGSFQMQVMDNSRYPTGTARVVYEWLDDCIPGAQALHIADPMEGFSPRGPVCMLGLSVLLTLVGMEIFKRKDIK